MARLIDSPDHSFRVHPADELGLVVDAEDYFRAFYQTALAADRYLLLSGWQFDSDVELLRGDDAARATHPVALLAFLNKLCEEKPDLQIWILAWDFHLVFAAEREWMQKVVFHWTTNERLRFRFDDNHVERGCHHQKFVVADGEVSFVGGLDLCDDRWDDRQHRQHNDLRVSRGEPHKPFHDVQAWVRGRLFAESMGQLFQERWVRAGGDPIVLPPRTEPRALLPRPPALLPLAARDAGLSRTDPHGTPGGPQPCEEIAKLHLAAIAGARALVYAETQYFSAAVIGEALTRRMRQQGAPRLEIVLVLNMRGETLKEQAAVGLAQAKLIGELRAIAAETGHALGIYYTLPACDDGEQPERATYIHSKLMIVDDRLLTVGSANLTNRSMGVDTELNLTVEVDADEDSEGALAHSIRAVRGALLAEHTGGDPRTETRGLVAALEEIARAGEAGTPGVACRLRRHPSPTTGERMALALVDPQKLPFDPGHVEDFDEDVKVDFLHGVGRVVRELLSSRKELG
ncbi:MAG: phospholipase D-like domain-containing protein [Polyangiales bacterium]